MKANRKMNMVVSHVKLEDEDAVDVAFWLDRTAAERLSEVVRLRHNYFTWTNGSFPEKMAKVVEYRQL